MLPNLFSSFGELMLLTTGFSIGDAALFTYGDPLLLLKISVSDGGSVRAGAGCCSPPVADFTGPLAVLVPVANGMHGLLAERGIANGVEELATEGPNGMEGLLAEGGIANGMEELEAEVAVVVGITFGELDEVALELFGLGAIGSCGELFGEEPWGKLVGDALSKPAQLALWGIGKSCVGDALSKPGQLALWGRVGSSVGQDESCGH